MSVFARFRRRPTEERTTAEDDTPTDGTPAGETSAGEAGGRPRWRRIAGWVTTALACLLVLFALIGPNEVGRFTPVAFLRIPLEGLLGVALFLVLPPQGRARRAVAVLVGVLLGVLTVAKLLDMGFFSILSRPFDPVLDWGLLASAVEFVKESFGRTGAIVAVIVAGLLTAAIVVFMTLAVLRLTRLVAPHRTGAIRTVAVLGIVWVACAVFGVQLVPRAPVASTSAAGLAYDRARQIPASIRDQEAFAAEVAVDPFRDTPADRLLTALRGKDVILSFVESYGRDAVEEPEFAQVGAVLDAGTRRLDAAGYASRSGFLTSPTSGGGSWLAHATLLSGLWIDNQGRYRNLVASDRLSLTSAFRRANWRTVGVLPGITRAWPEGAAFYGYHRLYDFRSLGYRGPRFSFGTMPDQYTLSVFERSEHGLPGRGPLMAEIALISSHGPWVPIPRLVDWDDLGDGSVFRSMAGEGDSREAVWRSAARVRTEYRRSIEYSLSSLISYVETYGDDKLVLVFLGDHQPAPIVTGEGASRDVPITIVTRDRAVMDRISGWGWNDGLKPGPQAPVWPMNTFRDRFLTTFGP